MIIDRREFLRATAASALAGLVAPLDRRIMAQTAASALRKFAPVTVARERIIREVVGLRPYRDEGYVVRAEKVGSKLLIHHYGHGGAGITLSWGTAEEAVELVRGFEFPVIRGRERRSFAVIGCGVIGLTTALLIQRQYRGAAVTIYTKDLPPNTTSNIAGGFWSPTSLFDQDEVTPEWITSFRRSCRSANDAFQKLIGKGYGVRWIDTFNLYRAEMSIGGELPGGNDLYPNMKFHRDPGTYFGFPIVREYRTMLIEPHIYLAKLMRDFRAAGGKIIVREFKSLDEMMRMPQAVIFNCTGLGARALFNDEKLTPARGQLAILRPQPEVDYCYLGPGYMFPRSDGIVLGGTFERDDWSVEPRKETTDGFMNTHGSIMRGLRPAAL